MADAEKKRHQSGASTDSKDANYVVTPPDGGWGWVICFASVLCNFVVDGIGYSFGIFLGPFSEYYGASKGKTSLVGSLLCGVYLCTGPIAGALVNRFGCRPVSVAGSIIATAAFFLSTLTGGIDGLIALYGALGGFGFGLIYLPAVVAVGYYFEKKRALATGLAVAGSGLGTIACPPFCRWLLQVLDIRGAVMVLAGIIFQCAILGMLMRPLEPVKMKTKPRQKSILDRIKRRNRKESEPPEYSYALEKLREARDARQTALDSGSETGSIHYSTKHRTSSMGRQHSIISANNHPVPTIIIDSPDGADIDNANNSSETAPLRNGKENGNGTNFILSDTNVAHLKKKHYEQERPRHSIHHSMSDMLRHRAHELFRQPSQEITKADYGRPMYRKDIFYSGSVANFHAFRSQPDVASYVASITAIPRNLPDEHVSSCPVWMCPCLSKSARDTLATMLDFSLLKDPSFLVIAFANVFGMFGLFIPFMYIVDRAVVMGEDSVKAASLISFIGVTNTLGRVIWGGLSDIRGVRAIWVNNATLFGTAIVTALCPLCDDYASMIVFACFFGLFVAGFIALTSVIICDLCGLENLTTGFGLLTLFRGVMGMIGPPIAGMLYDHFGSYDIPFYLAGGCFFVCAILHCVVLLPYFDKRRPDTFDQMNREEFDIEVAQMEDVANHQNGVDLYVDPPLSDEENEEAEDEVSPMAIEA